MNKQQQKNVVRMDDKTWRIIDVFGPGTVYSYLLTGTEKAILIDTGAGLSNLKSITDELTSLPVSVVNTHGHLDHISCNYQYQTAYLHPADEAVFIQHSDHNYRYQVLEASLRLAKLPTWLLKLPILRVQAQKISNVPASDNRSPLSDGMRFDLGGRTIVVLCTPGHTHGSVCLLDIERRQMFSGDTVGSVDVLIMLDHSTSVETYRSSVLRLKAISDRFDTMWSAHHKVPLDHSWMDDYILGADQILAGVKTTKCFTSAVGSGLVARAGRINIVYDPNRIHAA